MLKKNIPESKILETAKNCAALLDEKKAKDILLMDLRKINSYFDYFIICTGNSHIHCGALAKEVQKYFKNISFQGVPNPRLDSGWIALDYYEIVIHIFTKDLREYYQLERLWGDAKFINF
ncbi:MAG: ribosome silencing factor [Spirochaetota bacterium]